MLFQEYTPAIVLLILLPFLLSSFSTLNFRDKSSLKILYRHPFLFILPTATFFTFSRLNINCNSSESRVTFSTRFTYINIAVTTVGYVSWLVWLYCTAGVFRRWAFYKYVLPCTLPFFVASILLTALFLHLDKLPFCNAREQLSVYDPDLKRRFIMVDGEVVEDPEDDVETKLPVTASEAEMNFINTKEEHTEGVKPERN